MNRQLVVVHRGHIREAQVVVVQQAVEQQPQRHLIPVQCQVVLEKLLPTVHRPPIIIETTKATVQEKPFRETRIINVTEETYKLHLQASQYRIPLISRPVQPRRFHPQAV